MGAGLEGWGGNKKQNNNPINNKAQNGQILYCPKTQRLCHLFIAPCLNMSQTTKNHRKSEKASNTMMANL